MAAKKIRGDTPQQASPNPPGDEQFSDIVLILDKMELLLQAVSKIDKNGKHETLPVTPEHRNSFFKFDRHASMFENFIKNLWSQLKDPTRFGIFSVKDKALDDPKVREAIEDLAAGKKTDAVAEFLKKYEIKPKEQNINNQNDKEMAKQAQTTQAPAATSDQPKYRYNESMINWEQLKNFGLSREYLRERGLLEQMLRGYKTNQTVPIAMNFGSAVLRTDARLSFQQSIGGPVVLAIHGIASSPTSTSRFLGISSPKKTRKTCVKAATWDGWWNSRPAAGNMCPRSSAWTS